MGRQLTQKEIDMLQRFFDYELSGKELEDFKQRMDGDADFRKEVQRFQDAHVLTQSLQGLAVANDGPPQLRPMSPAKSSFKWWKIGAAVLLVLGLVAAAYFWQQSQNTQAEERVYASVESYVDKMSDNIMRSHNSTAPTPLSPIQQTMQQVQDIADNNEMAVAITQLGALLQQTADSDAQEVILWWTVRLQLNAGDTTAAKQTLSKIANNDDFNSANRAKETLQQL